MSHISHVSCIENVLLITADAESQGCHGGDGGQLLDHRPHQQHGPPEILSKAFAKYSDLKRLAVPDPSDCNAAIHVVAVATQPLYCLSRQAPSAPTCLLLQSHKQSQAVSPCQGSHTRVEVAA